MEHVDYFGVPLTTLLGIVIGGILVTLGKGKLLIPLMLWAIMSTLLLLVDPQLPCRLISGVVIVIIFYMKNRIKISS